MRAAEESFFASEASGTTGGKKERGRGPLGPHFVYLSWEAKQTGETDGQGALGQD